jgi:hypothetical protein
MSKTWKWILGILVGLFIVALIAAPFIWRSTMLANVDTNRLGVPRAWDVPRNNGRAFDNWNRHPMLAIGRSAMPFGGLFMGLGMLLSLIVPAGILFAIIYGAVRLAIKNGQTTLPPAVAPPATHPCPKCGFAVQAGWKHCPECGTKQ